jgi:hypothetical protein
LLDPPQPLKPGMLDDLHQFRLRKPDETINRVVYYFTAHFFISDV